MGVTLNVLLQIKKKQHRETKLLLFYLARSLHIWIILQIGDLSGKKIENNKTDRLRHLKYNVSVPQGNTQMQLAIFFFK